MWLTSAAVPPGLIHPTALPLSSRLRKSRECPLVSNLPGIFLCSFPSLFFGCCFLSSNVLSFSPSKLSLRSFFKRLALPANSGTVSSYYCTPDLHYLDFIAITMSIVNHYVCTQLSTLRLNWKPGDSSMRCKRKAVLLGFVFSHQTPRAET